jgi:hypothetical protein
LCWARSPSCSRKKERGRLVTARSASNHSAQLSNHFRKEDLKSSNVAIFSCGETFFAFFTLWFFPLLKPVLSRQWSLEYLSLEC